MNKIDRIYEYLETMEYFTSEELELVTSICGYTEETLNNMLYVRYGYRDLEQMIPRGEYLEVIGELGD